MGFVYCNPNPVKRKTGDCVVRALSIAFVRSWDDVYDELCKIGKEMKVMPSGKEAYLELLNKYPTIPIFHMVGSKKKRFLVKEITQKGVFICRVAGHLVAVKNGDYFDLFDCGNKSLYKCWKVM